ncbi:glycosyltransferase family 39 protein [Solitalea sp. MAHUQ-68]|uniref:Glycosyltransferase family 39 protein n=1 Tax=Solitalea agri TaxID=2953739 RepID=A0A9X2F4T2_9SPHI|nr:glycosyltransferase family 39 protein [Solitalea agri]MCO4294225.1 glycosyltransferase family 39 protein [Solitalea agri]
MKSKYFRITFLTILVIGSLLLATANLWGVTETSEARYAEISREMMRSGDWVHPSLLNIHHYHKPPITYWLTAISYLTFGVNPFAARFFLVIAYCLQIYLIFKIAKELLADEQKAWYASVIYATLPIVLMAVKGLTTDLFMVTSMLAAIYCWIEFLKIGKYLNLYGFALFLGIGFLTKGPAVFVIPFFSIISFIGVLPKPRFSLIHYLLAAGVFIVVGLSWFAYLIHNDQNLADYFIYHHLVDRVAHAEVFARRSPWYYYLPLFPLVSFPWIIIFFRYLFVKLNAGESSIELMVKRIVIWWLLVPLIVYSISSSKLILYILPLFTGFSLITAYYLNLNLGKRMVLNAFVLMSLLYLGLAGAPFYGHGIYLQKWLALLPVSALIISSYFVLKEINYKQVFIKLSLVFTGTLIIYSAFFLQQNILLANGISPITEFIKGKKLINRPVLVYDKLLPSLAFELDKDIISIYAGDKSLIREVQFEKDEKWRNSYIDLNQQSDKDKLQQLLSSKVVVVSKKKLLKEMEATMQGWQSKSFGKWTLYYN